MITNTPGASLDVHSATSSIAQFNQTTATNNSLLVLQNSGSALWRLGNYYNSGANDFGIFDVIGAIQPITIKKTTGQTFIGAETTSSGKLVVNQTASDNGIVLIGTTAPSIRVRNAGTSPTQQFGLGLSTGVNNFIQGSVSGDFCIFNGSTTASPITFGVYDAGATNIQEAARISASRNFLIGTSIDAGQKLQVNGTSNFTGTLNGYNAVFSNTIQSQTNGSTFGSASVSGRALIIQSGSSNQAIQFKNAAGGDATLFITGTSTSVNYSFNTYSVGDAFVITNNGNIGIGTSSPTQPLQVQAISNASTISLLGRASDNASRIDFFTNGATSRLFTIALGNAAEFYADANIPILFSNNGTEKMRLAVSTGNLLIGTTTDGGQKLQVAGVIYANGNESNTIYTGGFFFTPGTYTSFRQGTDQSFNIETYNGGTYKNALKITQIGYITLNLPTSSAGLPSGTLWNNLGIVSVAP